MTLLGRLWMSLHGIRKKSVLKENGGKGKTRRGKANPIPLIGTAVNKLLPDPPT